MLISASAGYGKTSLLSSWALQSSLPVYWLTLDSEDEDPIRFIAYLIETVQHFPPSLKQDLTAILHQPNQDLKSVTETVLTGFLRGCQDAAKHFYLVLDDYHLVQSPAIHKVIAFLVEQAPSPCHIAIATRQDPPLPLARFRLEDQLIELRNEELCFTDGEIREFFGQIAERSLSDEEVIRLNQLTEGWIAGIKLVSLSMKKHLATEASLSRFKGRNRDIFDYLSEELLCLQPPETRSFLLKTSILKSFTASLCEAVTGHEYGQKTLEYLEKANLFIVPLDRGQSWYRYHHLFSTFLLSQLQKTDPSEIPVLHRRAAAWYAKTGDLPGAIGHYLEANDHDQAEKLVLELGTDLLMRGEVTTLKGWLNRFPKAWLLQKPSLCILMAWSMVHTNAFEEWESYLIAAEKDESLRPQDLAIRVVGATSRGEKCLALALKAAEALERLPEKDPYSYHLVSLILGFQYAREGRLRESSEIYQKTAYSSWTSGTLFTNTLTLSFLAQNRRILGKLKQGAEDAHQAILNAGANRGEPLPMASVGYMVLGYIRYEQHDLEQAKHYLKESIKLDQKWRNRNNLLNGMLGLMKASKSSGAPIHNLLNEIDHLVREPDLVQYRPWVLLDKARIAFQDGDLATVENWIKERGPISTEGRITPIREEELMLLADYDLLTGQEGEALAIANRLLEESEATGSLRTLLNGKILYAMAANQKGETEESIRLLREAISLAKPQNFISPFADRSEGLASLLTGIEESPKHDEQEFLHHLLSILKKKQVLSSLKQLTEREREVLKLIVASKSNVAIADQIFVTPCTVKKHIQNIYSKLNITSRQEACLLLKGNPFINGD